MGDEPLGDPNITKVLPCDEDVTMLSWGHSEVVEIHRRRYMLKSDALEIFLISGKTLLLSFESTKVSSRSDTNFMHDRSVNHNSLGCEQPAR